MFLGTAFYLGLSRVTSITHEILRKQGLVWKFSLSKTELIGYSHTNLEITGQARKWKTDRKVEQGP